MKNTAIKSTPKDVFLHLFNIVTFYLTVIGFIALYIQYINALFPDPLNYYFTSIADSVRWATSILFIAVPAYLITSWFLSKDMAVTPEKRDLKLRKWLVYFTLFISAITIVVDLMVFVYNFLNGEMTIRFFLKVLVVLLVALATYAYYRWDLKRKAEESKIPRMLGGAVSLIAGVSILIGFFVIGTPADQRERRFDEERVQDLQILQGQIIDYWTKKDNVPSSLSNLEDKISGFTVPKDPRTQQPYEYKVIDPLSFELCAVFAMSNQELNSMARSPKYYDTPYGPIQQNWNHATGRTCFTRTIDPELYNIKDGI